MKNSSEKFSIKKRIASFRYAYEGLRFFIATEHNARIHLAATIAVIVFGLCYKISKMQWIVVCVVVALVFAMEMVNTAIEKLCDFVAPEKHEIIKQIKDISAAAVLISAVAALITALIIFLPKMI
ncbi:MAG TPA: diacylglycerol kinase family protein [Arachidicoccus sp.]